MDISAMQMMRATIGHSVQPDAFQSGREAAQMAKSQLPEGKVKVALTLGPNSASFQDFIEGVRLVTGDDGLVGFPSANLITNEIFLSDSRLVCLLQSDYAHVTVASTPRGEGSAVAALTNLFSKHRALRGNAYHQFSRRGLILIDNSNGKNTPSLIHQAGVEFGLDGWVLSFQPTAKNPLPLMCGDAVLPSGLVGIEILSEETAGIGSVGIGAFDRQSPIVREAVKAALREAKTQMQSPSCLGILLYDFEMDSKTAGDILMDLKKEESLLHDMTLLGFQTKSHAIKYPHRIGAPSTQSVTVLLLPL